MIPRRATIIGAASVVFARRADGQQRMYHWDCSAAPRLQQTDRIKQR